MASATGAISAAARPSKKFRTVKSTMSSAVGGASSMTGLRALWSGVRNAHPSQFAALRPVLAIRPGRKGEVLDVEGVETPTTQLQVAWKAKRNAPKKPSLTLVGEELYAIEDNGGVATCWEARTGKALWSERIGGNFSASPLAAEGRLYFFSEEGKTTIVSATREFKKLAENQLGDGFMASPAVSGKALFLRSRTNLYRIEE
jgi:outer membrane protein assembly factor BamB